MSGDIISHYRILEKLGSGGMGVVYRAEDTRLKRTVALKFLPPDLTRDPEAKQRFIHEAQAASALDHNNIAIVHDVEETADGQVFIVMGYIDGETLKAKIERGPLPVSEALRTAIEIANGLQEAHRRAIVHRDIKPANILITSDGTVKIVDFGLARRAGATMLTKTGSTLGTVAYMSPEQAKGDAVDARTDLWSLGILIYEMVIGQRPFNAEYENAVAYSILNDDPPAMTGLRTGVPLELERIVRKCLVKDRAKRYQHIDEIIVDLLALQAGLNKSGTPSSTRGRTRSAIFRKSSIWILVLLTAVVLLFFQFGPADWYRQKDPKQSEWLNSIAVLPLRNVSPDPGQEYFCDGMTEQLITSLSNGRELKVIGSQSVMRLRDSDKSTSEIGDELGVAYLLRGSVRRAGNRLRTSVQLIKARDGSSLWGGDFDGSLEDVFAFQDSVSRGVTAHLIQRLTGEELNALTTRGSATAAAYDDYLKGRSFSTKFDRTLDMTAYHEAEKMFQRALAASPNYAPAVIGLADHYQTYIGLMPQISETERDSVVRLWKHFADLALVLAPRDPDAYLAQDGSYDNVKRAYALNPNHQYAVLSYGYALRGRGLVLQSLDIFERAHQLNPLQPWVFVARGQAYWLTGETRLALDDYERGLQLEPSDYYANVWKLDALIFAKRLNEAERQWLQCKQLWPDGSGMFDLKAREAWLLAAKGETDQARVAFAERKMKNNADNEVLFYGLLGMRDEGLTLLNRLLQEERQDSSRSRYITLAHCQAYDGFRGDPRFATLIEGEKEKYQLAIKHYGLE